MKKEFISDLFVPFLMFISNHYEREKNLPSEYQNVVSSDNGFRWVVSAF